MISDRLQRLAEYPFTRLTALLEGIAPPAGVMPVNMALGEPQHAAPPLIGEILAAQGGTWNRYPTTAGTDDFRAAAASWLARRYGAAGARVCPSGGILPVSGTREALFLAALLAVPTKKTVRGSGVATPAVCLPNPFYAVYEGAAVMAGAEPVFLDTDAATGHLPDLDALAPELLDRTALFYLCSPVNPQGAVAGRGYLERLVALARAHDFVLALDECYSEIYDCDPPPGGLEAAAARAGAGDGDAFANLLVFHSLSKRSNAAGLRAGFVAGDPALIDAFRRLRGYACAGMPLPVQAAAAALWRDEAHVEANRALYRAKFDAAERALAGRFGFYRPPGGFFLWLDADDGEAAARRLWAEGGIRVLPGAFLTRPGADGRNRGRPFIRVALVHDTATVADALQRLGAILSTSAEA